MHRALEDQYHILEMKDSAKVQIYTRLLEECLKNESKERAFARVLKLLPGQSSPNLKKLAESRGEYV